MSNHGPTLVKTAKNYDFTYFLGPGRNSAMRTYVVYGSCPAKEWPGQGTDGFIVVPGMVLVLSFGLVGCFRKSGSEYRPQNSRALLIWQRLKKHRACNRPGRPFCDKACNKIGRSRDKPSLRQAY